MWFLSKGMILQESVEYRQYQKSFDSAYRKINLYNVRRGQMNEGKTTDILFTMDEKEAINKVLRLLEQELVRNYYGVATLNEGVFDDLMTKVKSVANTGVQKTKEIAGTVADTAKQGYEKMKLALQFIEEVIKKGINKVSEFIKVICQLIQKLGDCMRDAICKMLGFGGETPLGKEGVDAVVCSQEEKEFFGYVVEYVNNNRDRQAVNLNEGVLDSISDAVQKNKILKMFICGEYKGKKIGILKSFLVSAVASIIIQFGIRGILTVVFGPAAGVGVVVWLCARLWACRGIMKILLNRKWEQKRTGEDNFWNAKTAMAVLITVLINGAFMALSNPEVQKFLYKGFEHICPNLAHATKDVIDSVREKIQEVLGIAQENGGATPKDVDGVIDSVNDGGTVTPVVTPAETAKQIADNISGKISATDYIASAQDGVKDGWLKLPAFAHNFTTNVKYEGGFQKLVVDLFKVDKDLASWAKEHGISAQDYIKHQGLFADKIDFTATAKNGGKMWASIISTNDDTVGEFYDRVLQSAKEHGVKTAQAVDLGSGLLQDGGNPPLPPTEPNLDYNLVFGGLTFAPEFTNEYAGEIMLSFSGEDKKGKYVKVSDIQQITFAQAKAFLDKLGDKANMMGLKSLAQQDQKNTLYTKKLVALYKEGDQTMTEAQDNSQDKNEDLIKEINANADPTKDKCLVFFTPYEDKEAGLSQIPIVAINYRTMYVVDLINSKPLGTLSEPYYIKGLFSHLTIKPLKENDSDTKTAIKEFLTKMLVACVRSSAKLCKVSIGEVKKIFGKNTWKVNKDKDNDKERVELGNFTNNEIVDILNNPSDAYKYFNGKYRTYIKGTDDHGNVKTSHSSANMNDDLQRKFIEQRILPVISFRKNEVYKELVQDQGIKKYFMDEKGGWLKDGDKSILLSNEVINALLYTPETFQKDTDETFVEKFKDFFGRTDDDMEAKRKAKALQRLAEIVWKYRQDEETWAKMVKQYNDAHDKKIKVSTYDSKDYGEVKKKLDQQKKEKEKEKENLDKKDAETVSFNDIDNNDKAMPLNDWFNTVVLTDLMKSSTKNALRKADHGLYKFIYNSKMGANKRLKSRYFRPAKFVLWTYRDDLTEMTNLLKSDTKLQTAVKKGMEKNGKDSKYINKCISTNNKLLNFLIQHYKN